MMPFQLHRAVSNGKMLVKGGLDKIWMKDTSLFENNNPAFPSTD
jgi:hypothetical protein